MLPCTVPGAAPAAALLVLLLSLGCRGAAAVSRLRRTGEPQAQPVDRATEPSDHAGARSVPHHVHKISKDVFKQGFAKQHSSKMARQLAKLEEKRNPATPKICWKEGRPTGHSSYAAKHPTSLAAFPPGRRTYDGFDDTDDDDNMTFAEDKPLLQLLARSNQSQPLGRNPTSQGSTGAGTASCPKCDYTIDYRCKHTHNRHHFHRIRDCLLPVYGLTELLRRAKGVKCIVYWADPEFPSVEPIVSALMNDVQFHVMKETDACFLSKDMHFYTIEPLSFNRTHLQTVAPQILSKAKAEDRRRVDEYLPVDVPYNLRLLQCDALRLAGFGGFRKPGIVLLDRQGSRKWSPSTLPMLSDGLHGIDPNLGLYMYRDGETITNTFHVFVSAIALVGYHGAGFVNTLFSSRKLCLFEISTYTVPNSTVTWRSNILLDKVSPFLVWHIYRIPLLQLLEANQLDWNALSTKRQERMDHYIKDLPWVSLTAEDIKEVSDRLTNCMLDLWH